MMTIKWCSSDQIREMSAAKRSDICLIQISTNPDTWPDSAGFKRVYRAAFADYTTVLRDRAINRGFDQSTLEAYVLFSDEMARDIWKWVLDLAADADEPYLLVHCEAGISRSAGMAAAIALMFGQDPREMFDRAHPNIDVMGRMLLNYPHRSWRKKYTGIMSVQFDTKPEAP